MIVLVTCKNEEDPIKNEGAGVLTTNSILPLKLYWIFFRRSMTAYSAVRGRIGPNFEHIRDIMVVLLTCKNEEDPIKMKALD